MAGRQDIFAVLLAGLDAQASAKEINKQLNSSEFQASLDQLKTEMQLDEKSLKAIEKVMNNAESSAASLKKHISEAAIELARVESSSRRDSMEEITSQPFISKAQELLPGQDFSIIKKDIDATTKMVESLTIEFNKAGDAVYRMRIKADDAAEGGFTVEHIKMVETVRKEFKQYEDAIKSAGKEFQNLQKLQSERGQSLEITEEMDNLTLKMQSAKAHLESVFDAAVLKGNATKTEIAALRTEMESVFGGEMGKLAANQVKLSEALAFTEATNDLKLYKKEYTEFLQLQNKQQVQGTDFSKGDKERLKYLESHTEELKNSASVYDTLKQKVSEFNKTQKQSQKNNLGQQEVAKVAEVIKSLDQEYKKLAQTQASLGKADFQQNNENTIKRYQEQREEIHKNILALKEKLGTVQTTSAGEEAAQKGLVEGQRTFQNIMKDTTAALNDQKAAREKAISDFEGVDNVIKTLNPSGLRDLGDVMDQTNPKMQALAKEIYGQEAAIKKTHGTINKWGKEYVQVTITQNGLDTQLKNTTVLIDKQTGAVHQQSTVLSTNSTKMTKFTQQLQQAAEKMAVWGVAAKLLHGSLREMRKGFEFIKELDKDIVQAAIVTGKTRDQVKGLAQDYAHLGQEMGKSVAEISAVNTALLRQGLTLEESSARLDTVVKLSAAGQIETADSLHIITAAVNSMKESHVTAADVLLKASNISASSVEELGEAFTKTASSAYATGMSIQETTGILATMLEVTQEGPSQLGTSLKTILARFTRVNEETGEFNVELNKVQGAVESVGVAFVDADGQIRNVYDILGDLSDVWVDLDKNQQSYVATTAAGVRMQSRFFAVMNNFDKVRQITEETTNAAGSMNEAYEIYLTGVEAASKRAEAALQQMWINAVNSDAIKVFFDSITGLINFIDKVGLSTVAFGVGIVLLTAKLSKAGVGARVFQAVIQSFVPAYASATLSTGLFKGALTGLKAGMKAVEIQAHLMHAAITLGLSIAISAAVVALTKWIGKKQEDKRATEELIQLYRMETEAINGRINQLGKLEDAYDSALSKQEAGVELSQREKQALKEVAELYPEMVVGWTDTGEAILDASFSLEDLLEKERELIKLENERLSAGGADAFKMAHDNIYKEVAGLEQIIARREKIARTGEDGNNFYTMSIKQLEEKLALMSKEDVQYDVINKEIENRHRLMDEENKKIQQLKFGNKELFDQASKTTREALRATIQQTELYNNLTISGKSATNQFISLIDVIGGGTWEELALQVEDFTRALEFDGFEEQAEKYQKLVEEFKKGTITGQDFDKELKIIIATLKEIGLIDDDLIARLFPDSKKISNSKAAIQSYTKSITDLYSEAKELGKEFDLVDKAMEELNETGKISEATLDALIDINGQYIGLLGAEETAQRTLLGTVRDTARGRLTAEIAATEGVISAVRARIKAYEDEGIALNSINSLRKGMVTTDSDGQIILPDRKDVEQEWKFIQSLNSTLSESERHLNILKDTLSKISGGSGGADKKGPLGATTAATKAMADTYEGLTIQLQKNINALEENRLAQELAGDDLEKRLDLMKEEIKLTEDRKKILQELSVAYQQEAVGLEAVLSEAGFNFEGDGLNRMITNLGAIEGKTQEVETAFRRYIELQTSLVPQVEMDWKNLIKTLAELGITMDTLFAKHVSDRVANSKDWITKRKFYDDWGADNEIAAWNRVKDYIQGYYQEGKINHKEYTDYLLEIDTNLERSRKELLDKAKKEADDRYKKDLDDYKNRKDTWLTTQNAELQAQRDRVTALDQMQEAIVAIIRKREAAERQVLQDTYNFEMKILDEAHQAKKKRYSDDLNEFKRVANEKLKLLDDQFQEEDYLENLNEEREKAADLQKQIDVLSLDDSLTARNKKASLEKELTAQNAKIAKMQRDKDRKLQKAAIEEDIKAEEKAYGEKIDLIDSEYAVKKSGLDSWLKYEQDQLDIQYSNAAVYSEARQALIDGEVLTATGGMQDILTAYREFEDEFGKGMGILGNIIDTELIDRLEKAQQAIENLEYMSAVRGNYGDSDYDSIERAPNKDDYQAIEPREITQEREDQAPKNDYKNHPLYIQYERAMGSKTASQLSATWDYMEDVVGDTKPLASSVLDYFEAINRFANLKKGDGFIVTAQNFLKSRGWEGNAGFKSGGKIEETGTLIAPFHGTKSSPEWIFNDSQLKNIIRDVTMSAMKIATPKMPSIALKQDITLQIDNFIKADNITKDSIPELKKVQANAMEDLKNLLNKNGVRPSLI